MSKEASRSSIPDVLSIVGILFSAVFVFISLVHIMNGNLWVSGLISLLLIIVLYIIPERMAYFKSRKVRRQLNRSGEDRWQERALLGIYFLISGVVFVLAVHFVVVEFAQKNRIKQEGLDRWLSISNLRSEYDNAVKQRVTMLEANTKTDFLSYKASAKTPPDKNLFLQKLRDSLDIKALKGISQSEFDNALNTKKTTMAASHSLLAFEASNKYPEMITEATEVIKNWKFLKVGFYFKEADRVFEGYKNEAQRKMPSFTPAMTPPSTIRLNDPLSSITKGGMVVLLISIAVVVLLQFCILAPYLAAERSELRLQESSGNELPGGIRL